MQEKSWREKNSFLVTQVKEFRLIHPNNPSHETFALILKYLKLINDTSRRFGVSIS